jgi:hypothetical protein
MTEVTNPVLKDGTQYNPVTEEGTPESIRAGIQENIDRQAEINTHQGIIQGLRAIGISAEAAVQNIAGGAANLGARAFGIDSPYDPSLSELQQEAGMYRRTQPGASFFGSMVPAVAAGMLTGGIGSGAVLSGGAIAADVGIGAGLSALEELSDPHAKWENVARSAFLGGVSSGVIGAGARGLIHAGSAAVQGVKAKLALRGLEPADRELAELVKLRHQAVSYADQKAATDAIIEHLENPAKQTNSKFWNTVADDVERASVAEEAADRAMQAAADQEYSYGRYGDEAINKNYLDAVKRNTEAQYELNQTLENYSKQFKPEVIRSMREELAKNGDDVFDKKYGDGAAKSLRESGHISLTASKSYQEILSSEISYMENSLSKSRLTLDEMFDMVKGKNPVIDSLKADLNNLKSEFTAAKNSYKANSTEEAKQILRETSNNYNAARIQYEQAVNDFTKNKPAFYNDSGTAIKPEKVQQLIEQSKRSINDSGLLRVNKQGEYSIDFKKAEKILSTPEGKAQIESISRSYDDLNNVFNNAKNVPTEFQEAVSSQAAELNQLLKKNQMIESANVRAKLNKEISEVLYSPNGIQIPNEIVKKGVNFGKEAISNAVAGTAAHALGPLGGFAYMPVKTLTEKALNPLAEALSKSTITLNEQTQAVFKNIVNGTKASVRTAGNLAKASGTVSSFNSFNSFNSSNFNKAVSEVKGFNKESYVKNLPTYVDNDSDKEFLANKEAVKNKYLKDQLPAVTIKNGKMITSKYEQEKFQKIYNAVQKPDDVINNIIKNDQSVTKSEIDAVAAIYPIYFNKIKESVLDGLNEADIKNINVPMYRRQQLDLLFDLDGGGDKFLSSGLNEKIIGMTQLKEQEQIQPPPQRILANKPVKSFDSPSEQFLG